jgi:hypothetical protein
MPAAEELTSQSNGYAASITCLWRLREAVQFASRRLGNPAARFNPLILSISHRQAMCFETKHIHAFES